MSFLPIVERELREASRRKATFRIRWWVPVIGMPVSFFSMLFGELARMGGGGGNPAFSFFTGYALLLSLLTGIFLTGDCVSEEKREGTIGLLFLTNLRGYDVVLGKFTARSLNAFYGLLALLPLAGVPLLLGGVTGGEFWRVNLALINALFFSLAAGMLVSCVSRDSQRAMGGALGLVLFFALGLPLLEGLRSFSPGLANWLTVTWVSPLHAYQFAREPLYTAHREGFWWGLLASHLTGWSLLALAAGLLPQVWREGGGKFTQVAGRNRALRWALNLSERWQRWGASTPETRARTRAQQLQINPIFWLANSNRAVNRTLWFVVAAWGAVCALTTFVPAIATSGPGFPMVLGIIFSLLLKALLAAQSCRFFVEARRSGLLEAILSTPISSKLILHGQSLAFQRVVLWPMVGFFVLPLLIWIGHAAWDVGTGRGAQFLDTGFPCIVSGVITLELILDALAIRWFGMWLSLRMKNAAYATGLTILCAGVLPMMCCSFYCVGALLADLVLFVIGYSNCQQDLRKLMVQQTMGNR